MTIASPQAPASSPRPGLRRQLGQAGVASLVTLALLLPLVLLDRPPARPQLTFFGGEDGLSVLLEGAGGGRVLVGGGDAQADVPALLGRHLRPWDRRLDLLLVADARDLPGATTLVRAGDVRAVAVVGLDEARASRAALTALREACAARSVPSRVVDEAERIRVGRDAGDEGSLILEVAPAASAGAGAGGGAVRLIAGRFSAIVWSGAPTVLGTSPGATIGAILTRGGQEAHRSALAASPSFVVAPGAPPASSPASRDGHLLLVGPGERATLLIEARGLRLRGPALRPL